MSSNRSLRPGSSSEIAWVKYRQAAASSPCGPPNCSSKRLASPGLGAATRTVYCRRLLCTNISTAPSVGASNALDGHARNQHKKEVDLVATKRSADASLTVQ